ncbi:Uncharacterized protein ACO02O_09360 [Dirofilaria immitis]
MNRSSTNDVTVFRRSGLVGDCDTALESLKPIVVLTLYFVEDITKTYEFTEKELERFIVKCIRNYHQVYAITALYIKTRIDSTV